jgi:hypothetical protein
MGRVPGKVRYSMHILLMRLSWWRHHACMRQSAQLNASRLFYRLLILALFMSTQIMLGVNPVSSSPVLCDSARDLGFFPISLVFFSRLSAKTLIFNRTDTLTQSFAQKPPLQKFQTLIVLLH